MIDEEKSLELEQEQKDLRLHCWDGLDLTDNQKRFIMNLTEKKQPTDLESYAAAGYSVSSKETGRAACSVLKRSKKIKAGIKAYNSHLMSEDPTELRLSLINTLKRQANWKTSDFFNSDLSVKPLDEIPEEMQVCIEQVLTKYHSNGATNEVGYKMVDRGKAQDKLTKLVLEENGKKTKSKAGVEVSTDAEGGISGLRIIVES